MMFPGVTTLEQTEISQATFDIISQNLVNLGALSLDQYLNGDTGFGSTAPIYTFESPPSPLTPPLQEALSQADPVKPAEDVDINAITRLHQACQRAFRSTDALKFEFLEQNGSRNKQCILTITKPDGGKRSYATQPIFPKKNEAKAEAAKIAIETGALDFLIGAGDSAQAKHGLAQAHADTANTDVADASESVPKASGTSAETSFIDEIEKCCVEWRARRVAPFWIPFFEARLGHKQGCALRIQLSPHVVRVYLSEPTFDSYAEAKGACAKAAISEGVLDFIKHGNGQTRPMSPTPLSIFAANDQGSAIDTRTPWTLQSFYESLPRPFPESFDTSDASEINAPGWLNTMIQNARGGKLMMSFFFTSDGAPGLHGCLLKLDRPENYRAYLVDSRFPKRSDAKAAVCLQAMSQGIGDYIRSITSAIESKVTPAMRSFSSSLVYPALTSELNKISDDLQPYFEYDKERDAFGATLVVTLSTVPNLEQVRSYHVPCDYRNKADAKVAAICLAAEQGVIEFVRFQGGSPPLGYVSVYTMHDYDPETLRKRKQPGVPEEPDQGPSARKKKKGKHREVESQGGNTHDSGGGKGPSVHNSSVRTYSVPRPGDIGLTQGIYRNYLSDQSQPGYGNEGDSGAVHSTPFDYGPSYNQQKLAAPYSRLPDLPFVGSSRGHESSFSDFGHGALQSSMTHGTSRPRPAYPDDVLPPDQGPSNARPNALTDRPHHPTEPDDLEPGEVLSSSESEFSGIRSQNEEITAQQDPKSSNTQSSRRGVATASSWHGGKEKGKKKETSVADTPTVAPRDEQSATYTSHVKKLIDDCERNRRETPTFHQTRMKSDGKFEAWIVIGKERFDLPRTYTTAEEGWERVAKQVLVRLSKHG